MKLRVGRFSLQISVAKRPPDALAMSDFVLKRRWDELAVLAFLLALFALGILSALLGALASPDGSAFWSSFLGGGVLLAAMTLPIWLVQRWQSAARPVFAPDKVRTFRLTRLALLVLWLVGLGIAVLGLAINVRTQAPLAADLAVGLLIAYMAGWAFLVVFTLRRVARRRGWPTER